MIGFFFVFWFIVFRVLWYNCFIFCGILLRICFIVFLLKVFVSLLRINWVYRNEFLDLLIICLINLLWFWLFLVMMNWVLFVISCLIFGSVFLVEICLWRICFGLRVVKFVNSLGVFWFVIRIFSGCVELFIL